MTDTWASETDAEVVRRLQAYAQRRLSPSAASAARMRDAVMSAARSAAPARSAAGSAAETSAQIAAPGPSLVPFRSRRPGLSRPRRTFVALLAAALSLLLLSGVAFAAAPGGPLYGVRLWVETVSLPSDPVARSDADVRRLEARIEEAVGAARHGNGGAVSAALTAYRDILDDAVAAADRGGGPHDRLDAVLGRHRVVLATLLLNAPEPARDAIQRAIERSDRAVNRGNPEVGPKPKPERGSMDRPKPKSHRGGRP